MLRYWAYNTITLHLPVGFLDRFIHICIWHKMGTPLVVEILRNTKQSVMQYVTWYNTCAGRTVSKMIWMAPAIRTVHAF